jgi:16S rRNA (guanine(966)-N(2))-methyltransferase RsmD
MEPFAGSGAVGIEALSRGASHVVLNDRSEAAVELVRKNLANCGVGNGFELHCRDAFSFLGQLRGDSFDVVFLDPPYGFRRYPKLLNKLYDSLADLDRTVVILEIFKKTSLDFIQNPWHRIRTLEVGDTHFLFLGCCAAS